MYTYDRAPVRERHWSKQAAPNAGLPRTRHFDHFQHMNYNRTLYYTITYIYIYIYI